MSTSTSCKVYLCQKERIELFRIFTNQGLPSSGAQQVIATLAHWERHHGVRWVVDRLKKMRSSLLTGSPDGLAVHSDGTFKGSFRCVSRMANRNRRWKIRAYRILSIYGRWETDVVTKHHWDAFTDSISKEPPVILPDLVISNKDRVKANKAVAMSRFNKNVPVSNKKIVPFTNRREADTLMDDHLAICATYAPNILLDNINVFENFVEGEIEDVCVEFSAFGFEDDTCGRISALTSDRGLKVRFIANPHRLIQMGLSRLQDTCANYLRLLPESVVYQPDDALTWLKDQISVGHKLYCYDLSSATDHFPFQLQYKLVSDLFPDIADDIALWHDVVKSKWKTPYGLVSYETGQPMGTAPSFAAFTLTHVHFVRSLGGNSSNFRVLGDDIVITDPKVALRYKDAMEALGVSISLTKSLLGMKMGEFAGRIVDKFGYWPCFKASPLNLAADPLGYVRQYGLAGLSLVPKRVRAAIEVAAHLSLSPLMAHVKDWSLYDQMDTKTLLDILEQKPEPYTYYGVNGALSVFKRPISEQEASLHSKVDYLTVRGNNNPRVVVEHINANQQDNTVSTVLSEIADSLSKTSSGLDHIKSDPVPISYVKKLYKRVVDHHH